MHTPALSIVLNNLASAFCRMLFHALWQGVLLGVCMTGIKLITAKWNATIRYRVACSMLLVFLLICLYTFLREWLMIALNNGLTGISLPTVFMPFISANWFVAHQPLILSIWLCLFCTKLMQLFGAVAYNRKMLRTQLQQPGENWQQIFKQLCLTLKVEKTVALFESGCMKIPVVIGHLKPVILLPVGLLNALTLEQTEAVLLHELAHIRRNDWLLNFLQCLAESIFFFHPAVWMLSAWIRAEREHCCDEMVIQHTQSKNGLIEALIHFRQQTFNSTMLPIGFPGAKNQLLKRVQYIIQPGLMRINLAGKFLLVMIYSAFIIGSAGIILHDAYAGESKQVIVAVSPTLAGAEVEDTPGQSIPATGMHHSKKISLQPEAVVVKGNKTGYEPAIKDEEPVEPDPENAGILWKEAAADQAKALENQRQAMLDQQQAMRDQEQAEHDQEQAAKDQMQAKRDAEKSWKDQQQTLINKKEAERKRLMPQPAS